MIRVTVSYPNQAGARFDMNYYMTKHMPMVEAKLRPLGLVRWGVQQGIGGAAPGSQAAYLIQAAMVFETVEAFQAALAATGPALMADIPNYTDIQPRIDIYQIVAEQSAAAGA